MIKITATTFTITEQPEMTHEHKLLARESIAHHPLFKSIDIDMNKHKWTVEIYVQAPEQIGAFRVFLTNLFSFEKTK